MKGRLFEKAYQPFFLTGFISFCIVVFYFGAYPNSFFDVNFYTIKFSIATYNVWLLFAGYLFSLAGIYYIIGRTKLKIKKWLVISHYIFIVSFLIFFVIANAFTNTDVQNMLVGIPLLTVLTAYSIVLVIDITLFILGIIFLFISIISLRRDKTRQ